MKTTTKRKHKCDGCFRYEMKMDDYNCIAPVPRYIPIEQQIRWMKAYHAKMRICSFHMSQKDIADKIYEGFE